MDGEIAVLYQGDNQIGGLFDWEINTLFESKILNGWYDRKAIKKITARSYWFNVAPDGYCFEIKFYKAIQGQLVLIGEGKVGIVVSDKTLARRLYSPIEIRCI